MPESVGQWMFVSTAVVSRRRRSPVMRPSPAAALARSPLIACHVAGWMALASRLNEAGLIIGPLWTRVKARNRGLSSTRTTVPRTEVPSRRWTRQSRSTVPEE
jgi:hypothetical protein